MTRNTKDIIAEINKNTIVVSDTKVGYGNLKIEKYDNILYYTLSDVTGSIVYNETEMRKMVDALSEILN